MNKQKTVILNQLSENRAEYVASCRFFNNKNVTWEKVFEAKSKDINQSSKGKQVLVINDTTEYNYFYHRNYLNLKDREIGPMGYDTGETGIGFLCHPGLVIDSSNGVALGFSYLKIWNREYNRKSKKDRKYKQLPIEEKESYRWIECGKLSKETLSEATEITIIADRESDIYEEFAELPDERTNLIIRSRTDRVLEEGDTLYQKINSTEVCESYELKVNPTATRKARNTIIDVKYTKVKIKKPNNLYKNKQIPDYVELTAIEAKEAAEKVPEGEEPIHWILLTTHKVNSKKDAFKIIIWYCMRWQIELLFGTTKSKGMNMEASELESGKALKTMCVYALYTSLMINQLRQLRDDTSGIKANLVFTKKEIELLKILGKRFEGKTEKQKNPYKKNTIAWAAWTVARLGGWKGYAKESPPGNKTFKWGLDRFYAVYEGFDLTEKICA